MSATVGKNVLITRPAGQAEELVAALQAVGCRVAHYPVLAIAPLQPGEDAGALTTLRQRMMNLDTYQRVIFISTNAVRYGFEWIEQFWPQLPEGIEWYAIGTATATAMAGFGVSAAATGREKNSAMNTEALLAAPAFADVSGDKILIVRGVGGREALAEALRDRGAIVDYVECYRRALPVAVAGELGDVLRANAIDTVLLNSAESLENFCQLLTRDELVAAQRLLLVLPGERVAAIARGKGFQQLCVAQSAASADIVAAVTALQSR